MLNNNEILNILREISKSVGQKPAQAIDDANRILRATTFNELVHESQNIVAFTGAGISTESGIPDFRSHSGIYTSGEFEGYNPEDILSRKMFRENPKVFYSFYKQRLVSLIDKQPNKAHFVLAELEKMGKLKAVVTQNIDNLHFKAGSKNVFELHGSGARANCVSCNKAYTYDEFHHMLDNSDIAKCPICQGKVKPSTVLFDEWLNDEVFDNAANTIAQADLLIVIGSSLMVQPAAGLVTRRNKNCTFVIINNTETYYDKAAHVIIRESCGDVLHSALQYCINHK